MSTGFGTHSNRAHESADAPRLSRNARGGIEFITVYDRHFQNAE